jgi:hypothetical protein
VVFADDYQCGQRECEVWQVDGQGNRTKWTFREGDIVSTGQGFVPTRADGWTKMSYETHAAFLPPHTP